jgi:hypothetical protein
LLGFQRSAAGAITRYLGGLPACALHAKVSDFDGRNRTKFSDYPDLRSSNLPEFSIAPIIQSTRRNLMPS